jgi:hypothetical protein
MEPRTFAQRNIWSKLGNFKSKSNIKVIFGRFFEKIAPNAKKYRPNGENSSNLVTLADSLKKRVEAYVGSSKFECSLTYVHVVGRSVIETFFSCST